MQKGRMNVRLIFTAIMVSISIFTKAQNITIQVVDEANNPLSEVFVSVKQATDTICVLKTDTKGFVQCSNILYGSLVIEASKENYQTTIMNTWYSIQSRDVLTIHLFDKLTVFLDSLTINASHQMADYNGQILVTRSQYKTMAGSFQDPSRVMLHFPGFSTDNDGTNAFFFRGLPGYATHWQIHDAEIVNPNHLITAGNRGDALSVNSGGVNALTSSIIGSYKFIPNPASISQNNTTGGVSNLQLAKKMNNYLDLSLIGLDAGVNSKFSDKYTYATARYSFVGLLEKLGVPFGGESINYQDFSFVSELIKSKKFYVKGYVIYGQSSNSRQPLPRDSIKTSVRDFKNIQYRSQMGIAGLTATYSLRTGKNITWTLNYSGRSDKEKEFLGTEYSNLTYIDSLDQQDKVHLLSTHFQFNNAFKKSNVSAGIRSSAQYQSRTNFDEEASRNFVRLYPYLEYNYSYKSWTFGVGSGLHAVFFENMKNAFTVNYSGNVQKFLPRGLVAKLQHRYSDQVLPIFNLSSNFLHLKTGASEISIGKQNGYFTWKATAYYMKINNNISAVINNGNRVSTFNGLDFNADYTRLDNESTNDAQTYGIEGWAMKSNTIRNYQLDIIGNASFSRSYYRFGKEEWLPSKTNVGFSASLAAYLTKQNKRTEWNFGGIFHARGGLGEYNFFWGEEEFVWLTNEGLVNKQNPYQRLDIRIVYTKKGKSKRQHRISLDIQNVLNRKNDGYQYFDAYLREFNSQKQLGLVPVIGYRFEF